MKRVLPEEGAVVASFTARGRGERVAFLNGCFDGLHVGHLRLFEYARMLAPNVIVGISSDAVARRKDRNLPRMPQAERAELVAALRDVDVVFCYDDPLPTRLVERIRPHYLVKGADYINPTAVPELGAAQAFGGCLMIAPWTKEHSSSAIFGGKARERPA